jgi:WD40 repeat protein
MSLVKDYGKLFENFTTITITPDQKHLFISSAARIESQNSAAIGGALKQFQISSQALVKDFGIIHSKPILNLSVSANSLYMLTCSYNAELLLFSVSMATTIVKNFATINDFNLEFMKVLPDFSGFYISDSIGNLKYFRIGASGQNLLVLLNRDRPEIVAHDSGTTYLESSFNSKNLFLCDKKGSIKQYKVPFRETDENLLEKAYLPDADGMTVSIFKLAKNDEIFVTAMKLSGLRIYSVPKKCLLMAFRRQYANFITSCLEISSDCQNFYTSEFCYWQSGAASNRCLKKYSLLEQNLEEEDFVPIIDANENIDHICITKDSKYLFTIDSSNYLKKFSVENLLMKKSGISMLSNILKQASLNMIQNYGQLTFGGSLP